MKKALVYGFGAIAAVMTAMAPAHAATVNSGQFTGANLASFDSLTAQVPFNTVPYGPFSDGNMNFSGGGSYRTTRRAKVVVVFMRVPQGTPRRTTSLYSADRVRRSFFRLVPTPLN